MAVPGPAPQPLLKLENVTKVFPREDGPFIAVQDVNLAVAPNTFVTLVGPSGCGKTTVLRMLVGLTQPTEGEIHFRNEPLRGVSSEIGYITQEHNLYPWMTLLDNVAFPLEARGIPRAERYERAQEYIRMVGLQGFERSYPDQLSGGMQKRGSIVRTLCYDPEVILMDEPFGALDAQTRMILQQDLLNLWQKRRKTIIFITHDLNEAVSLSDVVVVMKKNPGEVKAVYEIDLPRPRDVFSVQEEARFHEIFQTIWRDFKDEMRSRKI